jgi:hypothetical protein
MTSTGECFQGFVDNHCEFEQGVWIQLEILHDAFLEFCINQCKKSAEWMSFNTSLSKTLNLALLHGALLKGSTKNRILVGIDLITYP